MDIVYNICCSTHKGLVRANNQDSVFCEQYREMALLTVADGMGGHFKGEVASGLVVEKLKECWQYMIKIYSDITQEIAVTLLSSVVQTAHKTIGQETQGMVCGTTVTILFVIKNTYILLNVGDSRAYQLQNKFLLRQLTVDDTWETKQMKQGVSKFQIRKDKKREMLLQAVGAGAAVIPNIYSGTIKTKQVLFVCTDGLYKFVTKKQIQYGLAKFKNRAFDLEKYFFEKAFQNQARDNISFAVLTLKG